MTNKREARPPQTYRDFIAEHPKIAAAYQALGQAVRDSGPLSEREVALAKLALAVGARMEGGVHAHVRKALAAGVERAAIEQVVLLAIPTLGFPSTMAAFTWIQDALDDE